MDSRISQNSDKQQVANIHRSCSCRDQRT
jgi:hypothetical protein